MDVLTRQGAVLMPMIGWMEHDVTQKLIRSEKKGALHHFRFRCGVTNAADSF